MLADKTRRNQLALFLGAGVSVGARLPGWRELIRQLASGLREPIALSDLEIGAIRSEAAQRYDFDIEAFHDKILRNGMITLPTLRRVVLDD